MSNTIVSIKFNENVTEEEIADLLDKIGNSLSISSIASITVDFGDCLK